MADLHYNYEPYHPQKSNMHAYAYLSKELQINVTAEIPLKTLPPFAA